MSRAGKDRLFAEVVKENARLKAQVADLQAKLLWEQQKEFRIYCRSAEEHQHKIADLCAALEAAKCPACGGGDEPRTEVVWGPRESPYSPVLCRSQWHEQRKAALAKARGEKP